MGKAQQQQKNIISQQNIQLIEQIGEGEFGTGKSILSSSSSFDILFSLVFKAFWKTKQNELVSNPIRFILTTTTYSVNRGCQTFE